MDTANSISREFTVGADAATVFAFFTDPQRLIRWIGVSGRIGPASRGYIFGRRQFRLDCSGGV